MKSKICAFCIASLFLISCASIPHYEEKRMSQKSRIYEQYSFEQTWDAVISSIIELGYFISNMDKTGGFIYAVGEEPIFDVQKMQVAKLNITIKENGKIITITCQVYTGIRLDPDKEIEKFFGILDKKINCMSVNYTYRT